MSNTFFGVAIDCVDAATVANFWAEVLGRQVADHPTREHAVVLVDDDGVHGPRLAFHQVPEPKTVKNRVHLDLIATEFEAETDRLVGLGAQKVRDIEQSGARWTTFRDIEGNEFDLVAGERSCSPERAVVRPSQSLRVSASTATVTANTSTESAPSRTSTP
jgi:catechol 2,3-dioxygenase-like lactoylglutathione lyase family enzyme